MTKNNLKYLSVKIFSLQCAEFMTILEYLAP
jgi:hypothetical protein